VDELKMTALAGAFGIFSDLPANYGVVFGTLDIIRMPHSLAAGRT
jgi:hypothetical protein